MDSFSLFNSFNHSDNSRINNNFINSSFSYNLNYNINQHYSFNLSSKYFLLDNKNQYNPIFNNNFPPNFQTINDHSQIENHIIFIEPMSNWNILDFDKLFSFSNSAIKPQKSKNNKRKKIPSKQKFICQKCNKIYKRKEYLKKHEFFKHTGYKGIKFPLCRKIIKYFHEHFKFCKAKYELNINKNKNSPKFLSHNIELSEIESFNDLKNFQNIPINNKEEIILNNMNIKGIDFDEFKYFNNYNIGAGGNMLVFYGKNKINNDDLAVKIEFKDKKFSYTLNEIKTLTRLNGISQIPKYFYYEYDKNKNIIAESLFGPSIKKFYDFNHYLFDHVIMSIIGIQIIKILKQIHEKGLLHNDLKPSNICWGKFQNSYYTDRDKFFLIDFGYARMFVEKEQIISDNNKQNQIVSKHYSNFLECKYAGTCEFMAIISQRDTNQAVELIFKNWYTLYYF